MYIFTLLEEVQTIARNGLNYTQNPYDRERYERLLELSTERYSEILDVSSAEVQTKLRGELGHITPKLGADAAIFNAQGQILLTYAGLVVAVGVCPAASSNLTSALSIQP